MTGRITTPSPEPEPVAAGSLDRRGFLKILTAGSSALVIGAWLPPVANPPHRSGRGEGFHPSPLIEITPDNMVTVIVKHLEMGQGVETGLASLVAEELDAGHDQVRTRFAPVDPMRYGNLLAFGMQATLASTSMANSYLQYRHAGAIARAMLVAAAAARWRLPRWRLTVDNGVIRSDSGDSITFGELAPEARAMPLPLAVTLKRPAEFRYIGKRFPRLDVAAKIAGRALYVSDLRLPDMLTAIVARPLRLGAKFVSYDADAARSVSGVRHVVPIDTGIAVLATNTWAAMKGAKRLAVTWDDPPGPLRGNSDFIRHYCRQLDEAGTSVFDVGNVTAHARGAATTIQADFLLPFLCHAPTEPVCAVLHFDGTRARLWIASQLPELERANVARVLGIADRDVEVITLYAGGSFGRRACFDSHYAVEAARIVSALDLRQPVKLMWTREDDLTCGYFRPLYVHRVTVTLERSGQIRTWHHAIAGQAVDRIAPAMSQMTEAEANQNSFTIFGEPPYVIPDLRIDFHDIKAPFPVLAMRSGAHGHAAFVFESFIDDLAYTVGEDPVAYRRRILDRDPRYRIVLDVATERAGWGVRSAPNRYQGVALHRTRHTYVALVAEIEMLAEGRFRVTRITCAVDCGVVVNPEIARRQIEGGIGYGLDHALRGAVTIRDGEVVQRSFRDTRPLRMPEMPPVDVVFIPSDAPPTGVGEAGVPPVAPAIANALFAATGIRIRTLPFSEARLIRR